jgi:hypothetical protein
LKREIESESSIARAARRASGRQRGRRQPTEEALRQTPAIVENDAAGDCWLFREHLSHIAYEVPKRDTRRRRFLRKRFAFVAGHHGIAEQQKSAG